MHNFFGSEASIGETLKDTCNTVGGSRDSSVLRRASRVRTADKELQAGCTRAVRQTERSGELDKIASGDEVAGQERCERVDTIVSPRVLGESGLNREEEDGAVGTSALKLARLREGDTIVEGQTEGFVDILTALAIKEVLLQVIAESKERAALYRKSITNDAYREN